MRDGGGRADVQLLGVADNRRAPRERQKVVGRVAQKFPGQLRSARPLDRPSAGCAARRAADVAQAGEVGVADFAAAVKQEHEQALTEVARGVQFFLAADALFAREDLQIVGDFVRRERAVGVGSWLRRRATASAMRYFPLGRAATSTAKF